MTTVPAAAAREVSTGEVTHRSTMGGPLGRMLDERRDQVLALAARHGLTNVRVFGSVARGDDGPDSDVDLLQVAVDLVLDAVRMRLLEVGEAVKALPG